MDLSKIKAKAQNYKAFGEAPQGFDGIMPINLIIGKNNTGKSALVDIINYCVHPKSFSPNGRDNKTPKFFVSYPLQIETIQHIFPSSTSGGSVIRGNHFEYGKKWENKYLTCSIGNEKANFESIEKNDDGEEMSNTFNDALNRTAKNPLERFHFRRLFADRDITPESPSNEILVTPEGKNATSIIQKIINTSSENHKIVEQDLLEGLNHIFFPDFSFRRIFPRQIDDGRYEIFLEEEKKGLVKLSSSGSGLKTVLLVLINTIVLPKREKLPLERYIFAFEELENNLHPGTQRRLFSYLREQAEKNDCHFLLTTHSSVVIDMFSGDKLAQIIHVTNDGENGQARLVQGNDDCGKVIDDLDVRASDLLQSNSVIWVEGPSDRTYINKWIELITNGQLKEGRHYQCVFYGGKLLARLQANPDLDSNEVNILHVNRHAILVMDRDRSNNTDPVNETKKRMKQEVEGGDGDHGIAWITAGREIENYIPHSVLSKRYPDKTIPRFSQYTKFPTCLNKIEKGLGDKFVRNKNLFASEIIELFTADDVNQSLNLKVQLIEVCNKICKWNNIEPTYLNA